MTLRLWLVRHGATAWSNDGRLCGWTDVPLSDSGRTQATMLRHRLAGLSFEGIWASDLRRADEFAMLAIDGAVPDDRLREVDFGDLEGRRWEDCDAQTRDALTRFDGFSAPGGESLDDVEDRVCAFLGDLARGEHLLFTHGGVIRLLTRLQGLEVVPAPGELTLLDWPPAERYVAVVPKTIR